MLQAIKDKLKRIRSGEPPRVIDLFSGCGGISLGTQFAGGIILGAIEMDPQAAKSHAINFHSKSSETEFQIHAKSRDITQTPPKTFIREICPDLKSIPTAVDFIVGGPPCQAFARVGRAKLREINDHPEAFLHDNRSGLYRHYLKYVEELAPVGIIVENVPDVLNYGGINIFELMANALEKAGYNCCYSLLNAAHYGVPQMRTRCFLIGIHKEAEASPTPPPPTHIHNLPVGYHGSRNVALKHMNLFEPSHYIEPQKPKTHLPNAVTAFDAISDLPKLTNHLANGVKKGAQRFDRPIAVPPPNGFSDYIGLMRSWVNFESDGFVYDHVIRFLPRDFKLFRKMKPGDQYPEAHLLAQKMFEHALRKKEKEIGKTIRKNSIAYQELYSSFVPPYDPGKFPNKWRKMEADSPARTLMAHIGKDTYSHIHYDSEQARTISVREAARLQSFPDGFRFSGTMNPAFRQIGNAVPPLLSYSVAHSLIDSIIGVSASPPKTLLSGINSNLEIPSEPLARSS